MDPITHVYTAELPHWPAVCSEFDLAQDEPGYACVLSARDKEAQLTVVLYSDDGVLFSGVAATSTRRRPRRAVRRLPEGDAENMDMELTELSRLYARHGLALWRWMQSVAPASIPEVVQLTGPRNSRLRLLRDALGLSLERSEEVLRADGRMRVGSLQFHSLSLWAQRIPQVTLHTDFVRV